MLQAWVSGSSTPGRSNNGLSRQNFRRLALLAVTAGLLQILLFILPPSSYSTALDTPASGGNPASKAAGVENGAIQARTGSPAEAQARLDRAFAQSSLSFEENQGQFDPEVKFLARGKGYNLFLTGNEVVFSLSKPKPASQSEGKDPLANPQELLAKTTRVEAEPATSAPVALRMAFKGGNAQPRLEYGDELPNKTNYLMGNDSTKWRSNIANYGKIYYRGVYPGIDLVFYGNESQLEYDWLVGAGADPSQIKLGFEGASGVELNGQGELVLHTPNGELIQHVPQLYQNLQGQKKPVGGHYRLTASPEGSLPLVSFGVENYDRNLPLVIDPSLVYLVYSSYFGGSGGESGNGIAVDSGGNAFITGYTLSVNFPLKNAFQPSFGGGGNFDAFIAKFDSSGGLVYSSYFGDSGDDEGYGIAVDGSGSALITGLTNSTNFPIKNAFQSSNGGGGNKDAFIAKFDASGGLVYSSYFGGSGDDTGYGIAVDGSGNALITGFTNSTNLPLKNAFQPSFGGDTDVFIAKFTSSGGLVYSSYFGGSLSDKGYGIAVDNSGNAFITGFTYSGNFPLKNAFQPSNGNNFDAFIAKFTPNGGLVFSTYFGGSLYEVGYGVAVDGGGNALLTGYTSSTNFPLKNAFQPSFGGGGSDVFIAKFDSNGGLIYSSYFGGSGGDTGYGIVVDGGGNALITGYTSSTNFPLKNAFQPSSAGGGADVFIAKFDPNGGLAFSSYFGGSGGEYGYGIGVDSSGNAFITGYTTSTNLPTKNAFQSSFGGGYDAFIFKISISVTKLVTVAFDDSSPGTLSDVIANASNGDIIGFAPGITNITFKALHAPLPALKLGVTLQGVCTAGSPQIFIDGTGVSGNGLSLSGYNQINGILIRYFGGYQLFANKTLANKLQCVRAKKQ